MTNNNGDIHFEDIKDFSFNPGLLSSNSNPVLKMKISQVLFRLDNFAVPKGWRWGA